MERGPGKHWKEEEVKALLSVWAERNIRKQLHGTLRNREVFIYVAKRLRSLGVYRDWKQCRAKYKNLKYEYRTVKHARRSGDSSRTMKFFHDLDAILQSEQLAEDADIMCLATLSSSTAPETTEGSHLPSEDAESHAPTGTMNDPGAGRHWSETEVRALTQIWPEDKTRQMFEETTRTNRGTLEERARRPIRSGIHRDPKQCHDTSYKDPKHEHRVFQKTNDSPQRKQKFQGETDFILKSRTPGITKWKHETMSTPLKQTSPEIMTNRFPQHLAELEGSTGCFCHQDPHLHQFHGAAESTWRDLLARRGPSTNQLSAPLQNTQRLPLQTVSFPAGYCLTTAAARFPGGGRNQLPANQLGHGTGAELWSRGVELVLRCRGQDRCFASTWKSPLSSRSQGSAAFFSRAVCSSSSPKIMAAAEVLNIGRKLYEGKTKEIYELINSPGRVLLQSKDQITAGNAARKNHMEGKAAISNKITSCIFQLLQEAGIKTAFTKKYGDTAFIAPQCEMIPIEWVCRRIATGSFLKRNPGVKEGYKFYPPKVEMFFKDDANNDPQWSEEQLIAAKFCFAGLVIGQTEVDIMSHATQAIFEILEKSWLPQNCTLVDMKIEFGVDVTTKEIVLADVIDNDSWRLWPSGDRSLQKDKQSYRDLKEVTPEGLQMVKKNFEWVADRVELLLKSDSPCRVVVLMGSTSDLGHCEKIKKACGSFGIPCELRVTSAHKGPDETLRIKAEYEGDGIPTVFVAVAGRSNGLGPVMSGNTAYPVISCPPITSDWGAQDVWSSLRLPSGLGCSTILSPEGSAQFAAQIFGLKNHLVWAKLRASILNTWISLKQADKKIRECNL